MRKVPRFNQVVTLWELAGLMTQMACLRWTLTTLCAISSSS